MPFDGTGYDEKWRVVLLKAADIVEERWVKNRFGEDGGRRCMIGALSEAMGIKTIAVRQTGYRFQTKNMVIVALGKEIEKTRVFQQSLGMNKYLNKYSGDQYYKELIMVYNDRFSTRKKTVVDLMRQAAKAKVEV